VARAMTKDEIQDRISKITPLAITDPEAFHLARDVLLIETLRAIGNGHDEPQDIARAALTAADITPAWEACS
jgi:hypothetical protein